MLHLLLVNKRNQTMTAQYKHLTNEERYHISSLRRTGINNAEIARILHRHPATISREIKRNTGKKGYRAKQAQLFAQSRKRVGNQQITEFGWGFIKHLIIQYWSPEQINGCLKAKSWKHVPSIERIYQFIYTNKADGGNLHTYLRCQKKKRKRYASGQNRRGQIVNRVGIEQRPVIADKRERIGDFEGDTIIGAKHKGAILTLVDRMARFTKLRPLQDKQALSLAHSNIEAMQGLEVNTITYDNGKEFAHHEIISEATGADIFFADPYSSWQRGTNENTNGLIRQFFPKKMPLNEVTKAQTDWVENILNNRPRKVLGYLTPNEVLSRNYVVALTSRI